MKLVSVIDILFYTFLHFCHIFSIYNCPVSICYMTALMHLCGKYITIKVFQLRQLHLHSFKLYGHSLYWIVSLIGHMQVDIK